MQEHLITLQLLQLLPLLSLVFQLGWPMLMTSYTWSQREVSLSLSLRQASVPWILSLL